MISYDPSAQLFFENLSICDASATTAVRPSVVFTTPLSDTKPLVISSSHNLVGIDEVVNTALSVVTKFIGKRTDHEYRKQFLMVSRCVRGGKTTVLSHIHRCLQEKHPEYNVLSVSFNGVRNYTPLAGEPYASELFRVITNELCDIDKDALRIIDWTSLENYINASKKPFILLIDEINGLCDKIDRSLFQALKLFIDQKDRYLIMSSHKPFLEDADGFSSSFSFYDTAVSPSSQRSFVSLQLPVCHDIDTLREMDRVHCTGITDTFVAFYGDMPSLIVSMLINEEEKPRDRVQRRREELGDDFVVYTELISSFVTGSVSRRLQTLSMFSSGVIDSSIGKIMLWAPCFMHCLVELFIKNKRCTGATAVWHCLEVMSHSIHKTGDGLAFELTTHVAILNRMILASLGFPTAVPFQLCSGILAEGAEVKYIALGEGVKTVESAKQVISTFADEFEKNTMVLFYPTESTMVQFDGYCVRYQDKQLKEVCAFQCKSGNKGASGTVPDWISKHGHLLRGDPPPTVKTDGVRSTGWVYYNLEDTNKFLGPSLAVMKCK